MIVVGRNHDDYQVICSRKSVHFTFCSCICEREIGWEKRAFSEIELYLFTVERSEVCTAQLTDDKCAVQIVSFYFMTRRWKHGQMLGENGRAFGTADAMIVGYTNTQN